LQLKAEYAIRKHFMTSNEVGTSSSIYVYTLAEVIYTLHMCVHE